jgi:hypothetical protein
MTLHIFNPEHDIALASGLSNFTAPHAGRQLRHDLGYIPALWAADGDAILVDDPEVARRQWLKTVARIEKLTWRHTARNILFVSSSDSLSVVGTGVTSVDPWGWDSALTALLRRRGLSESVLPDEQWLLMVRKLSHRRMAASVMTQLRNALAEDCRQAGMKGVQMADTVDTVVGESFECTTIAEIEPLLAHYGRLVLKSPWSSSGRGLRFLSVDRTPLKMQEGWIRNVIASQGSVMVEPYYNKVKDFGMEFLADGEGKVSYLGLSLFQTANGAYSGNILATETFKTQSIGRYVSTSLLVLVRDRLCYILSLLFKDYGYSGPLGVDMMIVRDEGGRLLLHPCVEINLRRTMGHVALSLSPDDDDVQRVMRIGYNENVYRLRIF